VARPSSATAHILVTAASVVVWVPVGVRGSRLVLARDCRGVQSAVRSGVQIRTYVRRSARL